MKDEQETINEVEITETDIVDEEFVEVVGDTEEVYNEKEEEVE